MSGFKILSEKKKFDKERIERGKIKTKTNEKKKRLEIANKWTSEITKELRKRGLPKGKINSKKKLEVINIIKQGRQEFLEQGKLSPEFIRTLKRFLDNLY